MQLGSSTITSSHDSRPPWATRPADLAFGPFRLDRCDASLWRDGVRVALAPKVHALLVLLVENAGGLVTKDDILATVWSDTFVTESVIKVCIAELRRTLCDPARAPIYIETQARVGYRFIAAVASVSDASRAVPHSALPRLDPGTAGSAPDSDGLLKDLLDAAERAASTGQYDVCTDQLATALTSAQFLFPEDRRLACDLLLRLGQAAQRGGRMLRGRAALHGAVTIARELGQPELLARAVLALGEGHQSYLAADAELVNALEEALEPLARTRSSVVARLQARLAYALYTVPRSEARRRELTESALDRARDLRSPGEVAWILRYSLWATWGPDSLAKRQAQSHRLVDLARQVGTLEAKLHAYGTRMEFALEAADTPLFERDQAAYLELASSSRRPWFEWSAVRIQIMNALLRGHWETAEARILEAAARARSFEHGDGVAVFYAQMVLLRVQQGRGAEIVPFLVQHVRGPTPLPSMKCLLAQVHAELGEVEAAAALLSELGGSDFSIIPRDAFWKGSMMMLADACAALEDRKAAQRLERALLPYAEECAMAHRLACLGSVHRPLGRLAALLGRREQARRHFDSALAIHERMGATHWVERTRRNAAHALDSRHV